MTSRNIPASEGRSKSSSGTIGDVISRRGEERATVEQCRSKQSRRSKHARETARERRIVEAAAPVRAHQGERPEIRTLRRPRKRSRRPHRKQAEVPRQEEVSS